MRKKFFCALVLMMLTMMIFGCVKEESAVENNPDMTGKMNEKSSSVNQKNSDKRQADEDSKIEKLLKTMTLEEKVGQMVMIGVQGTQLNDDIIFSLNNFHFGGVILFDRNMESVAQTRQLVEDIESAAKDQKVPLLIALDEEGGTVARGQAIFGQVAPAQEEIGRGGNPEDATYWAKKNIELLRSIGVNVNFAPVADIGSGDTRSFGFDAQTVTNFLEASVRGYEEENFLYTLKHFPGIGRSKIDPHQEVSSIDVDLNTLEAEDIAPFKKIICGHDNSKFMIMVGHLKYTALDSSTSASLSPAMVTDLLSDELGFSGVVITDDLEMGAIKNNVELSTLGVKMILAGGDIALVCHDYAGQQVVYTGILEAVKRGEISEARIDESVRRIIRLKTNLSKVKF